MLADTATGMLHVGGIYNINELKTLKAATLMRVAAFIWPDCT